MTATLTTPLDLRILTDVSRLSTYRGTRIHHHTLSGKSSSIGTRDITRAVTSRRSQDDRSTPAGGLQQQTGFPSPERPPPLCAPVSFHSLAFLTCALRVVGMPAATHGQGEGVCIEGGKAVDCMHDWGPVGSCGVDLNPFALVQSAVRSSFGSEASCPADTGSRV